MADYNIFFSWQVDSAENTNRTFIRKALDDAAAEIALEINVIDVPRITSGMEGIAGSPEVASVMFEKIDDSAIFVGDTTLVGVILDADGKVKKRVPNPNVSLEMGYAAATLGWHRVICVMNEWEYTRHEQPFDTRNRRFPIDYTLSPEMAAVTETRRKIRTGLKSWLKKAIVDIEQSELLKVDKARERMDVRCLELAYILGGADYFSEPKPESGFPMEGSVFNATVIRLLEIGLLRAHSNPAEHLYAYHWTYLGIKALRSMGIR